MSAPVKRFRRPGGYDDMGNDVRITGRRSIRSFGPHTEPPSGSAAH